MASFATCDILVHNVHFANGFSRFLPAAAVGEQSRPQLLLSVSLQGGTDAPSVLIPISDMHLTDWLRIRLGKATDVETTSGKSLALTIDPQQSLSALTISLLFGEGKGLSTLFIACGSLTIRNVYKDMLLGHDNSGVSSCNVQLYGLSGGTPVCSLETVVKMSLVPPHLRPFFAQQMEAQRIAIEASTSSSLGGPTSTDVQGLASAVRHSMSSRLAEQGVEGGVRTEEEKETKDRIRRGHSELASPQVYMPPPLWYGVLGGAVTVAMPAIVTQHAASLSQAHELLQEKAKEQGDAQGGGSSDTRGVAGGSPPHPARPLPTASMVHDSHSSTDLALIDRFLSDLLRWKMFTSSVKASFDAENAAAAPRDARGPAGSSPTPLPRSPSRASGRRSVGAGRAGVPTSMSPSTTRGREAFPVSPPARGEDSVGAWADTVLGDGYLRSSQGLKAALLERGLDEQVATRLVTTFATAKVSPGRLGQASGRLLKLAHLISEDSSQGREEESLGPTALSTSSSSSQVAAGSASLATMIASTLPRTYRLLADKEAPTELREALLNLAQLSALRESLQAREALLRPSPGGEARAAAGAGGQDRSRGQVDMDVTAMDEHGDEASGAGGQGGRGRGPYIASFRAVESSVPHAHDDGEEVEEEEGRKLPQQDTAMARPAKGATWWGKPPGRKHAAAPPVPPPAAASLNASSVSGSHSVAREAGAGRTKGQGLKPGQGAGRRPANYVPMLPLVSGLGPLHAKGNTSMGEGEHEEAGPVSGVRLPAHLRAKIAAQEEQRRAERLRERTKQEQEVQGGFGGNSAPSSRRASIAAPAPVSVPVPVPSVVTGRTLRPVLGSMASTSAAAGADADTGAGGTVISEGDLLMDRTGVTGLQSHYSRGSSTAITADLPDTSMNRSGHAAAQEGSNITLSGAISVRIHGADTVGAGGADSFTVSVPVPAGSLLPSPATAAGIDLASVGSFVHAREVFSPTSALPVPSPAPAPAPHQGGGRSDASPGTAAQGRQGRQQARAGRRLDEVPPPYALMLSQAARDVSAERLSLPVIPPPLSSPSPSSPRSSASQLDLSRASSGKSKRRPITAAAVAQIRRDEARARGYKSVEDMEAALGALAGRGVGSRKKKAQAGKVDESVAADVSTAGGGKTRESTPNTSILLPVARVPEASRQPLSAPALALASTSFISPVLNSSLGSTTGGSRVTFAAAEAEAAAKADAEVEAGNGTRVTSANSSTGSASTEGGAGGVGMVRSPGTPALFKTTGARRPKDEEEDDSEQEYKDATFDSSEGAGMSGRPSAASAASRGAARARPRVMLMHEEEADSLEEGEFEEEEAPSYHPSTGGMQRQRRARKAEEEGKGMDESVRDRDRERGRPGGGLGLNDTALTGVSAITGASSGKSSGLLSSISDTSL